MPRPKGRRRLSQRERHRLALAASATTPPLIPALAFGPPSLTDIRVIGSYWGSQAGHEIEAVAGRPPEQQIVIESLDQGATWHTIDTMEPASNQAGKLVIGTAPAGAAPECMQAGSGVYRFSIPVRRATAEEERVWCEEWEYRERLYGNNRIEEVRRWNENLLARRAARIRALGLLVSHLTPKQRDDFAAFGGFWVVSQFKNTYWVTPHTAVRFGLNDVALQSYCIYAIDPNGTAFIPPEDNALARMILLKTDEALFLRTANPSAPHEGLFAPRLPDPDLATPEQLAAMEQAALRAAAEPVRMLAPYLININGLVRAICG